MSGRAESVITPPVRGAQRTFDMSYPSPTLQTVGNNAVGIEWLNRQGVTTWSQGTVTGFGAPPTPTWQEYQGRVAFKFTGNAGGGGFYKTTGFTMFFPQTAAGIGGPYNDDYRCWRVLAIMAFDPGLGSGDIGLEVTPLANYDFLTALTAGYRLAPTSATTISVQARKTTGQPTTIDQPIFVGGATATAQWHAYEMRFIGATSQVDGIFKVLIDGVPLAQFRYGVGTLLPTFAGGGTLGYQIGVGSRGADGAYIAMGGLQVSAAATEDGLL